MSSTIPHEMRALSLERYSADLDEAIDGLKVVKRPIPALQRGQVLVRIEAAACNPSDLLLLQGKYGNLKRLPTIPGWEGSGQVVAHGGGVFARWLHGKRVACGLQGDREGTWSEYFVAEASECIPLYRRVPAEQAAGLIVNPLTAVGLLETARHGGHRAAVQTAAASQLGRMLIAMAKRDKYPLINVVRRKEQAELLKSLGAEHVLCSEDADFASQLQALCVRLGATAAFEAVGGDMTGNIINRMPPGSTVYVYGDLSQQPCGNIDPIELLFREKTVCGFFLGTWLRRRGLVSTLRAVRHVQRLLMDGCIETRIQRRLGLDDARDGLRQYANNMTEGKVLIMPHLQK